MGEFSAAFRGDRRYVKNHMWATATENRRWRFGLTEYAVRLLQDVYFLDWTVEPPAPVEYRMTIGAIESKKAESDLFSPISGTFVAFNEQAIDDPSVINADPYGDGWLIEIESDSDAPATLLTPEQYAEHLIEAWEVAQRTIKGQANT